MITFAPGPQLAPFVRVITLVETGEEVTRALLPATGIVLGVRYGGYASELDGEAARRLPQATLAGMRRAGRRVRTSEGGGIALATFTEVGAAAFFAAPLHEIAGQTVELAHFIPPREIERALARLVDAAGPAQRVAVMREFLLGRLTRTSGDPLVAAAVDAIRSTRGSLRIGELARALAISRDRLEKRFRHAVGASPKQLASIHRLLHAVDLYRAGTNLTRLSADAGYFDQSHFIREFRSFTGMAPQRYFRSVERC